MDIKRAKQEIKDSIEAYLMKDEFGEYRLPAIRQRPIFLVGPPGIGKTTIMEQYRKGVSHRSGGIYDHPSYQTKCSGTSVYPGEGIWRNYGVSDRIYHEWV